MTISRSLIAGSIDLVLAVLCIIPAFAPVGDSMILLQGVKNIGKLFGRSFVERVFKKVFSKKILKILKKLKICLHITKLSDIVTFVVNL